MPNQPTVKTTKRAAGHYKAVRSDGAIFFVSRNGRLGWRVRQLEPGTGNLRGLGHWPTRAAALTALRTPQQED